MPAPSIEALQEALRSALTMLDDLSNGYPWRELHIDLDRMKADAAQLGVSLDDGLEE